MSCNEIQAPIAIALAELEIIKAHLMKVYAWAGVPHVYVNGELSTQAMELELARVILPIVQTQIVNAIKLITSGIR